MFFGWALQVLLKIFEWALEAGSYGELLKWAGSCFLTKKKIASVESFLLSMQDIDNLRT